MSPYIFLIYNIYYLCVLILWPLHLWWLLVCCLYKEVYVEFFKCVSFWLHSCCGKLEGWAHKPVHHTSWVAVVTPTDQSVSNRSVIELFCGVVCVFTLPFWHFWWCRGFCHRTESDLFLFLLPTAGSEPTLSRLLDWRSNRLSYMGSDCRHLNVNDIHINIDTDYT